MFQNDSNQNFAPREMVKGNWKCADCGTEITELPFQPAPGKDILCKECWRNKRNQSNQGNRNFAPREMVKGNWKCADCGAEITEMPFEPAPGKDILCKECWRNKRNQGR